MPIKTPNILPGEKGYISKKEKTIKRKVKEKTEKIKERKKEATIGKIKTGSKGYRIGKPAIMPNKNKKYTIWRYSKKIGEILVKNENITIATKSQKAHNHDEVATSQAQKNITLKFNRLGGIGNYKHLIQDADFQFQWAVREQELLITQEKCFVCHKKLSKTAKPNLYHYNMFKKRTELLEKASLVPQEVVDGKLTIERGWEKFNDILEQGNRYYMSLKDTALICSSCAKQKGLSD